MNPNSLHRRVTVRERKKGPAATQALWHGAAGGTGGQVGGKVEAAISGFSLSIHMFYVREADKKVDCLMYQLCTFSCKN
jgi:hypothetical protein